MSNKWELRYASRGPLGQRVAGSTVWRVQNAAGDGPYRQGQSFGTQVNDEGTPIESYANLMREVEDWGYQSWDADNDAEGTQFAHQLPADDFHGQPEVQQLNPAPKSWPAKTDEEFGNGESEWNSWGKRLADWIDQNGYKFGFPSAEAATNWFGPYLDRLAGYGYNLVQLPATEVIVSDTGKQVLFK